MVSTLGFVTERSQISDLREQLLSGSRMRTIHEYKLSAHPAQTLESISTEMAYYHINVDANAFVGPEEVCDYWINTGFAYTSSLRWTEYNNDNFKNAEDKLESGEKQRREEKDAAKYGQKCLGRLNVGDTLLMYKNGTGIVAIGRVSKPWDGIRYRDLDVYRAPDSRMPGSFIYKIKVEWERLENPIPWSRYAEAGYTGLPNSTLIHLMNEVAPRLIGENTVQNRMTEERINPIIDILLV